MGNGVYNAGKTRVMPKGRPFQKGNRMSPGRPKNALLIPDVLRAIGNEPVPPALLAQLQASWGPDFKPANMREAALRVTYAQYAKGDPAAREFVANRTEGKVDGDATKALFNFGNINNGDNVQVNLTALIQKRAHEYIEAVRELGKKEGVPGLDGRDESIRATQALPATRTVSRP